MCNTSVCLIRRRVGTQTSGAWTTLVLGGGRIEFDHVGTSVLKFTSPGGGMEFGQLTIINVTMKTSREASCVVAERVALDPYISNNQKKSEITRIEDLEN